jgi:hypothetical protein
MFGIDLGSFAGKICEELGAGKEVTEIVKTAVDGAAVGVDLLAGNYKDAVQDGCDLVRDTVEDVASAEGKDISLGSPGQYCAYGGGYGYGGYGGGLASMPAGGGWGDDVHRYNEMNRQRR